MPIVSISEAARLTGKARSTIQAYIKTGKLSKTTDNHTDNTGIETSELIRVFGRINIKNTTGTTCSESIEISQQTTGKTTNTTDQNIEILQLKSENERLKSVLEAKQETIDSLKTALKLLEHRQEKTEPVQKENMLVTPAVSKDTVSNNEIKPSGFWNGLKKLFK